MSIITNLLVQYGLRRRFNFLLIIRFIEERPRAMMRSKEDIPLQFFFICVIVKYVLPDFVFSITSHQHAALVTRVTVYFKTKLHND